MNPLPSTWPRTFSAIGIGAFSLYVAYSGLEVFSAATQNELNVDEIATLFSDGDSAPLLLLPWIFFAYIVGDLILDFGWAQVDRSGSVESALFLRLGRENSAFQTAVVSRSITRIETLVALDWLLPMLFVFWGAEEAISEEAVAPVFIAFFVAVYAHVGLRRLAGRQYARLSKLAEPPALHES